MEINMDISNKKINFLGDSITEGVGVSSIDKVYWKLLELRDGCISRGYGISGTRIAKQLTGDVNLRMNRHFSTRVAEMDPDADVIVIFGGTNDYGHGDAAMGKMSDRTDETFYGALHVLYTSLMEKYPEAQIVVMTPCHRLTEDGVYNEVGIRNVGTLEDYVNVITEVSGYYGIPVLDLYRVSGMQPKVPCKKELYMPDGLHPSDAGHEIIYRRLRDFLLSL